MDKNEVKDTAVQNEVRSEVNADQLRAEGAKAERERVSAIKQMANGLPVPADVIEQACSAGLSPDQAKDSFLQSIRSQRPEQPKSPSFAIHVAENKQDGFTGDIAQAVMVNKLGGKPSKIEQIADKASRYNNWTLSDIARTYCARSGMSVPHARADLYDTICHSQGFGTNDFTKMLAVAGQHVVIDFYNDVRPKALDMARVRSVSTPHAVRLGRIGSMALTATSGGAVTVSNLSDQGEIGHVTEYGTYVGITRYDWLNDDVGAFADMLRRTGFAGAATVDDVYFENLMANATMATDSKVVYHADHNNSQASKALSGPNLTLARKLMVCQTDGGKVVGIVPKFLVVPPSLYGTAAALVNSERMYATDLAGDGSTAEPDANIHYKQYTVVEEARLETAGFTNQDSADWYLVAGPQWESITLLFLNGNQYPTIEQVPADASQSGVFYRVLFDVDATVSDYRGLVFSKHDA